MRLSNATGIFVCFPFLPTNDKMLFLINSCMRVNELRMTLPGLGHNGQQHTIINGYNFQTAPEKQDTGALEFRAFPRSCP